MTKEEKHRKLDKLYNADCFDVLYHIEDNTVDLVITDPPYLHTKGRGMNHKTGKAYANGNSKFANSDLYSTSGYMMGEMSHFGGEEIDKALTQLVRVCKIPNMYIFCNETQVPLYAQWATEHNLMFSILVWEKPLSIINRNRFSQNIEFIIRIYDYGTALNKLDGVNNIYNRVQRTPPVSNKCHPTQKPVDIVEGFIKLSTPPDGLILDPFMGSGTTCIAAIRQNRHYIGIEKSTEYFKIATRRINAENSQLKLFTND